MFVLFVVGDGLVLRMNTITGQSWWLSGGVSWRPVSEPAPPAPLPADDPESPEATLL